MTELPFDLMKANRWFAIECNNQAWDLVEAETRDADQVERMLHLAHASRYHWHHAGQEINWLRAEVLLSTAYSVAGRAENANVYAKSASRLIEKSKDVTQFDRTSVTGAYAFALVVADQHEEAVEMHGKFQHDLSMVEEPDDRALLQKLYGDCLNKT